MPALDLRTAVAATGPTFALPIKRRAAQNYNQDPVTGDWVALQPDGHDSVITVTGKAKLTMRLTGGGHNSQTGVINIAGKTCIVLDWDGDLCVVPLKAGTFTKAQIKPALFAPSLDAGYVLVAINHWSGLTVFRRKRGTGVKSTQEFRCYRFANGKVGAPVGKTISGILAEVPIYQGHFVIATQGGSDPQLCLPTGYGGPKHPAGQKLHVYSFTTGKKLYVRDLRVHGSAWPTQEPEGGGVDNTGRTFVGFTLHDKADAYHWRITYLNAPVKAPTPPPAKPPTPTPPKEPTVPAAPSIYGVDVSSHQAGYKPTADVNFVFIKATEGRTYISPTLKAQAAAARAAGVVVGFYHWLHPGNISAQAAYFVATAPSQPGDLLVCDWEESGCTNADKDAFIREVKRLRPQNKVGLYCNTSWWTTKDTTSYCGDFLWIARYDVASPGIKNPYAFWQYSDKPIDQNRGYFASRAALQAWARALVPIKATPAKPDLALPSPSAPSSKPDTVKETPVVTTTTIYPTAGTIRTPYGQRGKSWSWDRNAAGEGKHGGDDIHNGPASAGNPIYAGFPGRVIYAGNGGGWGPAFGNHVLVTLDRLPGEDFQRTVIDAHMQKLPSVKYGQRVQQGTLLGYLGATGNVSGPHDHHEHHKGQGWGDARVKPVYPGRTTTVTKPTPQEGILDMTDSTTLDRRKDTKLTREKWVTLPINDADDVSILAGPKTIALTLNLDLSGLPAGQVVQVRFITVDYKKGTPTVTKWTGPGEEIVGTAGATYGQTSFVGKVGTAPKGFSRRLRAQVISTAAGVTVTRTVTRILHD